MIKKMIPITVLLFVTTSLSYANNHKFIAVIQDSIGYKVSGNTEAPLPDPDPKMSIRKYGHWVSELSCKSYNGSYPMGVTFKKTTETDKHYSDDFCLTDKHSNYLHRECYEIDDKSHVNDWFCDDTTDDVSSPLPGTMPSYIVLPRPIPFPENPNGKEINGFHDK